MKKEILQNGLTVVTEEIEHANSASLGIWVMAGSRGETREEAGISHFLEHMNFKGTERRNAKELAEVLECRGGQLNAYTTKEYTAYYCQVVGEDWPLGLDVLSDLYLNSTFEPEDIEKEKNVIIEEINLYEDSPEDLAVDLLNGVIWGKHPLSRPILGYEDVVNSLNREKLLNYRHKNYTPGNTVLAAVGKIEHDALVEAAAKHFAGFQGVTESKNEPRPLCHSGKVSQVKDIMQEHICLGFPGLSIFDQDYYALILVNEILGGGSASRLFQTIREERALSYSVFSFVTAYKDCGMLSVYAGTAKGKGNEVADLCLGEIANLKKEGISPEDLAKLKTQISGGMRISLDSLGSRLSRLGRNQLYYGKDLPIDEVVSHLNRVTPEDMVRVATDYLSEEQMAYAFLGGKEE